MGYLNLKPEQTNIFFKLMEERYRRRADDHHHQSRLRRVAQLPRQQGTWSTRCSAACATSATPSGSTARRGGPSLVRNHQRFEPPAAPSPADDVTWENFESPQDVCATAYWYQTLPSPHWPALEPYAERVKDLGLPPQP